MVALGLKNKAGSKITRKIFWAVDCFGFLEMNRKLQFEIVASIRFDLFSQITMHIIEKEFIYLVVWNEIRKGGIRKSKMHSKCRKWSAFHFGIVTLNIVLMFQRWNSQSPADTNLQVLTFLHFQNILGDVDVVDHIRVRK